jgi:hypothetical protein
MMSMLATQLLVKSRLVKERVAGMTWKSTVVLSGAGVLATWMAAAPPLPSGSVPAAPAPGAGRVSSVAADVEEEASKLGTRLRQNTAYAEPSRNPFRFSSRRASERTEAPQPAVPPPLSAPVASEPPLAPLPFLAGVATDVVGGTEQRTAILSVPGAGVVLAREGDEVSGRYRVNRVEAEAVELVRLDNGSLVRLGLKP